MNYTRKKNVILDEKGNAIDIDGYKPSQNKEASINAAKRTSRRLQREGHTVRVIE